MYIKKIKKLKIIIIIKNHKYIINILIMQLKNLKKNKKIASFNIARFEML